MPQQGQGKRGDAPGRAAPSRRAPARAASSRAPAPRGSSKGAPRGSSKGRGPRGPRGRPKAVFWRRRLLVLGVVALLAVGLVWGVGRLLGILGEAWEAAVANQQAEPTDTSTAQPVACPPDALEWQLSHDAGTAGSPVRFEFTVENLSGRACLIDAGAQTLVLTVVSGEDRIWSNAHCGSADPVRLLLGPEDATTRAVTWPGARSAPGCAAAEGAVLPGTYQLGLAYARVEVPEAAAVFTLR